MDTDLLEARVTVGNDQLSLAIGKGGQNVRLAAKLTGFKIDLQASETVSDLDAAMQAAASRTEDFVASDTKRAAFDALFGDSSAEAAGTPEEALGEPAGTDGTEAAPEEEVATEESSS